MGKAIKVNPLIVNGFNMDFDGDTVAVHVPITEEARSESFKLLPSRNLYNPRSGELMNYPTQEAITGLFLFTQTAKGRSRLNAILPAEKYHIKRPMTGGDMRDVLTRISKELPNQFARVVNALKDIGNRSSYELGFSVGLEDLKIDYDKRSQIFNEAENRVKKATGSKTQAIIDAYTDAAKKLDASLLGDKRLRANSFMIMASSGAKGNIGQMRQILAAPVLVKDVHDRTVPVPIKRSYAEGLDLADYWSSMAGARKGMIDRSLQTSVPGAFAKELLNVTVNQVITARDCKTSRGVDIPVGDPDALDRYLARGIKGVGRRNTVVTADLIKKARRARVETFLVRSPLTCAIERGVCQRCYGISDNGKAPEIGTNVGVEAGQSMAEPATQMTMRTFHTGGAAGTAGGIVSGFNRITDLLKMPKILKGKATLARESGKVTRVAASPIGGWNIWVGDEEHHIPSGRQVLVKQGQSVSRGERLSDGPIRPQELLELRNMRETQDYIVDSLKREYANQGIRVRRRILETVVRPLTNTARITNPGGHNSFVPGDHASVSALEAFNRKAVEKNKIEYETILRGINTAPLMSEDWITRLNFQRLKDTLLEGPAQGWKSDIAAIEAPLAAYAYGPLLGREPGRLKTAEEDLQEAGGASD